MTNRFRFYSFCAFVFLLSLLFASGRAMFNQYFHHSKGAVALAELPSSDSNALIIINNHGGGQGPQADPMKRPSQVIRTDGTVVLDSESLGVIRSHGTMLYPNFQAMETWDKKQYILASVPKENYGSEFRWYQVQTDGSLKEIKPSAPCRGNVPVEQSEGLWQNCQSFTNLSVSSDGKFMSMQGWQYPQPQSNAVTEEEQQLSAQNRFIVFWNPETEEWKQLDMDAVMKRNNITGEDGIEWDVRWDGDAAETAFIIFYKTVDGEQKNIAKLRYNLLDDSYQSVDVNQEVKSLLDPHYYPRPLAEVVTDYPGAMTEFDLLSPRVNPRMVLKNPKSSYLSLSHSAKLVYTPTGAQSSLIKRKGLFKSDWTKVYVLDRSEHPSRYLVTIDDYMYIYDVASEKYALLTRLPFDVNFGINSVDVLLPANNAQ